MRIELASNLDCATIETKIKEAHIVDQGDFILYEKKERIAVDDGFDLIHIFMADIQWVEVIEGAIEVHTHDKNYVTSLTLRDLKVLPLIRINKSTLVNLDCVEDIRVKLNMKYSLRLKERWFDVNRGYYTAFKSAVGL